MKFSVLIPARYASERLPGKSLVDINGKPMIEHVWRRAMDSGATMVAVCTDDARIATVVEGFGGTAIMTGSHHASGTDRIAEAADSLNLDEDAIVVNLQGDEPTMPSVLIRQAAETLHMSAQARLATLATPISSVADYLNPNVVKVAMDESGRALYFSRAPIPWYRDGAMSGLSSQTHHGEALRHLGIYAYRGESLRKLSDMPPVPIEEAEKLEQLRALWHGMHIQIAIAIASVAPGQGVDTSDDLERVRRGVW